MRRAIWSRCHLLLRTLSSADAYATLTTPSTTESAKPGIWLLAATAGTALAFDAHLHQPLADVATVSDRSQDNIQAEGSSTRGGFSFLNLETRRRTFFNYEKRIRMMSTPEKIFEYFSSVEQDGVKFMTEADLLKALVPVYPPDGSAVERGGALLGEKAPQKQEVSFLNVFDLDGDNLISFQEYLMVLTFLKIPLKHINVVFDIVDKDKNGYVDKEEFQVVLEHMKKQSRQTNLSRGGMRTGLNVGTNDDASGLLIKFFGKDGKKKLDLPELRAFLVDLQKKLLVLEFMHYDYRSEGTIAAKDFARSVIAGTDLAHSSTYLKNIEKMDRELASHRVSRDAFLEFFSIVNHLPELETALKFFESSEGETAVTAEKFKAVVERIASVDIPEHLINIIFFLFADRNGNFNSDGFIHAFESRLHS